MDYSDYLDYSDYQTFRAGDRVELHPATDAWMRGDRFGTVVETNPASAIPMIELDRSGCKRRFVLRDLRLVK